MPLKPLLPIEMGVSFLRNPVLTNPNRRIAVSSRFPLFSHPKKATLRLRTGEPSAPIGPAEGRPSARTLSFPHLQDLLPRRGVVESAWALPLQELHGLDGCPASEAPVLRMSWSCCFYWSVVAFLYFSETVARFQWLLGSRPPNRTHTHIYRRSVSSSKESH